MHSNLISAIFTLVSILFALMGLILVRKAVADGAERRRAKQRDIMEPDLLSYAHAPDGMLSDRLGAVPKGRAARVAEQVFLDHLTRVDGQERTRMSEALVEMGCVDRYLADLGRRSWWKRADAADKLGRANVRRAALRLAETMDDPVPEVRIRAATALGRLGGQSSIQTLVGALSEPSRWSTLRIADILAAMGGDVVNELVDAWPTMNLTARIATMDILASIQPTHLGEWLLGNLSAPEEDVRARTCHALGAIGDPEFAGALTEALRDPSWPVRAMAAKALGRIGHEGTVDALRTALGDRAWWVRTNAGTALCAFGRKGTAALIRTLADGDRFACQRAALMLEESGEVDRQVDNLSLPEGIERSSAEKLVHALVDADRTDRLHELARVHRSAQGRTALESLLCAGDES